MKINKCIEEPSIVDLIGSSKTTQSKFYEHMILNEPIDCLDIGCGFPTNLTNCYHLFNCNKLIGVDNKSEIECVEYYVKNNENFFDPAMVSKLKNCKSFFEIYNVVYQPEINEKPQIKSKDTFDKIFINQFKFQDFKKYLIGEKAKFDLVICSNLLHFEVEAKQTELTMNILEERLEENGILLLRVQNKPNFDYGHFRSSFFNTFKEGEVFENYQNSKWLSSILVNRKEMIKE